MPNALMVQAVSDVQRATQPLHEASTKEAIESLTSCKVEACSEYRGNIVMCRYHPWVSPVHPFIAAVNAAFCDHRPLILSPDMLWLLIAQGFARHVNNNSEELRRRFVKHDKKDSIVVRRDDFYKGSPENAWSGVFSEFSTNIQQRIGEENHANIVVSFSTTGPVEKAANEVVLMDVMKKYFQYVVVSRCGIPEVSLEGTVEDWQKLCERTENLGNTYDLTWWTSRLVPTLQRIAGNAAGADDPELWRNIYKLDAISGGPFIDGWIVEFFPYLQTMNRTDRKGTSPADTRDNVLDDREQSPREAIDIRNRLFTEKGGRGIRTDEVPGSLCKTPFLWEYEDRKFAMEFLAGFIGFTQDAETLAVRPKIGWAVRGVSCRSQRQIENE